MYTNCIFHVFEDHMNWHLSLNHFPAPSPLSQIRPLQQIFFSLSLSLLFLRLFPPLKTRSIIIMSHLFACGVWPLSLFFAKWWNVLLFYFSSLTHSAFGEGEIISNYRESRRCRPSSCACSYLLLCGRRMMRVVGNMHAHFACSSPCLLLSFLSITCLSVASERDLSSRIGYLAAFGPI